MRRNNRYLISEGIFFLLRNSVHDSFMRRVSWCYAILKTGEWKLLARCIVLWPSWIRGNQTNITKIYLILIKKYIFWHHILLKTKLKSLSWCGIFNLRFVKIKTKVLKQRWIFEDDIFIQCSYFSLTWKNTDQYEILLSCILSLLCIEAWI